MRMAWIASLILLAAGSAAAFYEGSDGVFEGLPEDPAIGYPGPTQDPVANLNLKLEAGSVELKYDESTGYLRSVLDALHVPIQSQIVAMSKTSVQQYIITPQNPRTLYFNDSVIVGYVRGGFIEVAAQDPRQGMIFYTLGRNGRRGSFTRMDKPTFLRENSCLTCHVSYSSLGVAGTLLRSVFPAPDGTALYQAGRYDTDHRSPFDERYGGWYVTGESGPARHMGNAFFTNPDTAEPPAKGALLASLASRIDTSLYLSPYSDIVALLVFDHQMHMMNLLTRVGWEARAAKLEQPASLPSRLKKTAEEFVDYLLFVDEAPLGGKVKGNSGFAEMFTAQGPRDKQGRSLRQFSLDHRIMRYPCSYMIYTEAFDTLPSEAKDAIYQRLWSVLSGQVSGGKYDALSRADRKAVLEILRDTKKGLPAYFGTAVR